MNHQACPECGSHSTEPVHTEFMTDRVERVRICANCPTEWTVSFGNPIVEDVFSDE